MFLNWKRRKWILLCDHLIAYQFYCSFKFFANRFKYNSIKIIALHSFDLMNIIFKNIQRKNMPLRQWYPITLIHHTLLEAFFILKSSGVGCFLLPFYDLEILSPHQLFKRKKFMGKHFSCESNANTSLIVVDLILFQGSRQGRPCYGHYSKCQVINYQNKIYEGISKTIFGSTLKNRIKMINTSRH